MNGVPAVVLHICERQREDGQEMEEEKEAPISMLGRAMLSLMSGGSGEYQHKCEKRREGGSTLREETEGSVCWEEWPKKLELRWAIVTNARRERIKGVVDSDPTAIYHYKAA